MLTAAGPEVLGTCYPFDAVVPGGPLRLVVQAREVSARNADVNAPLQFQPPTRMRPMPKPS